MTKTDILDFLELPIQASDNDISNRLTEKYIYFTKLYESAPNDVLRRLHTKSKEKIKAIRLQLGMDFINDTDNKNGISDKEKSTGSKSIYSQVDGVDTAVCWLILHTENRPARSFPVFAGNNIIGRIAEPGKRYILIEGDPYLSRVHALLYVHISMTGVECVLDDSAISNGGKPSRNGTYINGNFNRITRKTRLSEGDTIQVGNTKLVLKVNQEPMHKILHEVEESEYMKTVVINPF